MSSLRFLHALHTATMWMLVATFALGAVGCADDVPEGSRLERTRVLGIAARPGEDAARAWPRPGEETALDWLVSGPGSLPPMSWSVAVCVADATGCTAEPFLVRQGSGVPAVSFVAPDAEGLLVVASVEPQDEPATQLFFQLPVEHAEVNHHPTVGGLTVAGRPWGEACEPVTANGEDVELRVATAGADRERYTAADGTARRETLRLSFFATAGELEGQFRVIEAEAGDAPEAVMKWTPPPADEVPDGGLEVDFTFVERDLRGGVDWTTRKLCVSR